MSTGDLIVKDFPMYKHDAMHSIAKICEVLINPHVNNRFTEQDFKQGEYVFSGSNLMVRVGGIVTLIIISGDFPRVSSINNVTLDSKVNAIPWDTAQRLIKQYNKLIKNLPENLGYYENILKVDFTIPYNSLRITGARGTRVHYRLKG